MNQLLKIQHRFIHGFHSMVVLLPYRFIDSSNYYYYYYVENHRDKRITRMDEYSDSEDEDDDRRNEKSYRDTKRPRLIENNSKNGVSRSLTSSRGQLLSSPLPPEPSPITPLPQDDNNNNTDSKSNCSLVVLV